MLHCLNTPSPCAAITDCPSPHDLSPQILRARYSLVELERDLEATVRMHGTLDKAIGAVEANQAEVHRALESIEEEAERRFQEESSRLDAAGSQRDRLYQRAVGVMEQLYRMDSYLREAAQNINAAGEGPGGNRVSYEVIGGCEGGVSLRVVNGSCVGCM